MTRARRGRQANEPEQRRRRRAGRKGRERDLLYRRPDRDRARRGEKSAQGQAGRRGALERAARQGRANEAKEQRNTAAFGAAPAQHFGASPLGVGRPRGEPSTRSPRFGVAKVAPLGSLREGSRRSAIPLAAHGGTMECRLSASHRSLSYCGSGVGAPPAPHFGVPPYRRFPAPLPGGQGPPEAKQKNHGAILVVRHFFFSEGLFSPRKRRAGRATPEPPWSLPLP